MKRRKKIPTPGDTIKNLDAIARRAARELATYKNELWTDVQKALKRINRGVQRSRKKSR